MSDFIDKIPESIPIMGIDAKISKLKIKDFGAYCYNTHSIQIQHNLDDFNAKSTLIHEIVHGIFRKSGLHYKLNNEEMEEAICQALETGFFPLIDFKFEHQTSASKEEDD